MSGFCGQAAVVVCAKRNTSHAIRDAIEINYQSCRGLRRGDWLRCWSWRGRWLLGFSCRLLVQLFVEVFGRLFWLQPGRSSLWFRSLIWFGDYNFITFWWERMLNIPAQTHSVDVSVAIRGIVEFNLRNLRGEFTITKKEEIVTLRIPCGVVGIEHVFRDAAYFAIGCVPNVHRRKTTSRDCHTECKIVSSW